MALRTSAGSLATCVPTPSCCLTSPGSHRRAPVHPIRAHHGPRGHTSRIRRLPRRIAQLKLVVLAPARELAVGVERAREAVARIEVSPDTLHARRNQMTWCPATELQRTVRTCAPQAVCVVDRARVCGSEGKLRPRHAQRSSGRRACSDLGWDRRDHADVGARDLPTRVVAPALHRARAP